MKVYSTLIILILFFILLIKLFQGCTKSCEAGKCKKSIRKDTFSSSVFVDTIDNLPSEINIDSVWKPKKQRVDSLKYNNNFNPKPSFSFFN